MESIKVRRYKGRTGYQGLVEPESRDWILFIADDGTPELWRATKPASGPDLSEGRDYRRVSDV